MEIPGIGIVVTENEYGCYDCKPISRLVRGGKRCRMVVEGYDDDASRADCHVAIANCLSIGTSVLREVESKVFRYCQDLNDGCWSPDDGEYVTNCYVG